MRVKWTLTLNWFIIVIFLLLIITFFKGPSVSNDTSATWRSEERSSHQPAEKTEQRLQTLKAILEPPRSPSHPDPGEKELSKEMDQPSSVKSALTIQNHLTKGGCIPPVLDPFAPSVKKHFKPEQKPNCSVSDWVYVHGGRIYFRQDLSRHHPEVLCYITSINRADESTSELGTPFLMVKNGTEIPSDSVGVSCKDANEKKFETIFASVKRDEAKVSAWKEAFQRDMGLPRNKGVDPKGKNPRIKPPNILMVVIDSMSHNAWKRYLPKTYAYLTKNLGVVPINGYNIVGDGTPQALLPILTGLTEKELPEARHGHEGAKPVNGHPWIWGNFSDRGYATAFVEDGPQMGTFNYRMLGFVKQPTDVYGRTHFLGEYKLKSQNRITMKHNLCIAGLHRYKASFLNLIREHFRVLPDVPKFMMMFAGDYSHQSNNLAATLDVDLLELFVDLSADWSLEETILITFSDHGARFSDVRATEQGKIEERMPFFGWRFPGWFKQQYPELYANFVSNARDALVTPFDIHATFHHLLNISSPTMQIPHFQQHLGIRAISLLERHPPGRSCRDADIEPHWCACLQWHQLGLDDKLATSAASSLVNHFNGLTEGHRSQCAIIRLNKILTAAKFETEVDMRRFKKSKDADGFVPDLTENTAQEVVIVQVTLETLPGNALFEGVVKFLGDVASVGKTEISRLNKYGKQPACIAKEFPYLRQFCYCI